MAESMVERVARALHARKYGEWYDGPCTMTDSQRECLASARAAIEAMREPTRDMIARGSWHRDNERLFWQAMIDAALNEQVSG